MTDISGLHWCPSILVCAHGTTILTNHEPSDLVGECIFYALQVRTQTIVLYLSEKYFSLYIYKYVYSPCPNLEGIKDALSYKFRRLTIGQKCCAVCTNEVAKA